MPTILPSGYAILPTGTFANLPARTLGILRYGPGIAGFTFTCARIQVLGPTDRRVNLRVSSEYSPNRVFNRHLSLAPNLAVLEDLTARISRTFPLPRKAVVDFSQSRIFRDDAQLNCC